MAVLGSDVTLNSPTPRAGGLGEQCGSRRGSRTTSFAETWAAGVAQRGWTPGRWSSAGEGPALRAELWDLPRMWETQAAGRPAGGRSPSPQA